MLLRPYQSDALCSVRQAWADGLDNPLLVLPTGGGKTVVFSSAIHDHDGPAVAIAHRQELVSQISLSLARYGVRHRIIGPENVVRFIVALHMRELGRSYYDPNAWCAVAGVDTITRRADSLGRWLKSVTLWVMDEAHHVLKANKWGKAIELFPNARGLGVTATPERADGKGLARWSAGVFDTMVEGPAMRWLIEEGYITDYTLYGPPSDFKRDAVPVSQNTGDFVAGKMRAAVKGSHIMGDIVTHYRRHAGGRRGVTFMPDVESAAQTAEQFRAAGVRAEVVSAKTPDAIRVELIARLRAGELDQLVNVDLFGEGFDLPAIDAVSFGRPTESLGLYMQQFGRALRPVYADGFDLSTREGRLAAIAAGPKPKATILDHVGNSIAHRLPDSPRPWSLEGREAAKRNKPNDAPPVRACPECTAVYERFRKTCPACGHYPEPAARSAPEFVDGDLTEIDADTLAQLRGEIEKINGPARIPQGVDARVAGNIKKQHHNRQEAQAALRASIAWWAGYQRSKGRDDSESYRRFYHVFGVDVLNAQAMGRPDALKLADKINWYLGGHWGK